MSKTYAITSSTETGSISPQSSKKSFSHRLTRQSSVIGTEKWTLAQQFSDAELSSFKERIERLLAEVPANTLSMAGKKMQTDEFVVTRTKRYRKRTGHECQMPLAAIETIYLWPTFMFLTHRTIIHINTGSILLYIYLYKLYIYAE